MTPEQIRQITPEFLRWAMNHLKTQFLSWRIPPIELPNEALIENVIKEIIARFCVDDVGREPQTSGDAWREWFRRMGERANADVVNATATLVIAERATVPRYDDSAMLDWLDARAEEGMISICFEVDGGIHVTLDPVGSEQRAARYKNTVREAIAELMPTASQPAPASPPEFDLIAKQQDLPPAITQALNEDFGKLYEPVSPVAPIK